MTLLKEPFLKAVLDSRVAISDPTTFACHAYVRIRQHTSAYVRNVRMR